MSSREIIRSREVNLSQNENGDYVVSKDGYHSYTVRPNSRTCSIIRIFDSRCLAQQRRYDCANDIIHQLTTKLEKIEASFIYRLFHKWGFI